MNEETLYVLCWRVVSNGKTGHGTPLPLEIAEALLLNMSAKNDGMVYWLEVWQ